MTNCIVIIQKWARLGHWAWYMNTMKYRKESKDIYAHRDDKLKKIQK